MCRHARSLLLLAALPLLAVQAACGSKPPTPGARWVNEIRLVGVKALDADEVIEGLETQQTPWYWWMPIWGERRWLDPANLDSDIERIVGYYATKGFFSAKVTDHKLEPVAGGRGVDIELTIDEGRPTKVSAVALRGVDKLPAEVRAKLRRGVKLPRGARYDHGAYEAAKGTLPGALKRSGYPYATLEGKVAVDRDRGTARVELTAKPGPRVRFGKATISGQGPIPLEKLRPLIRWEPGEIYDPEKIDHTREKLFALRVFSSVRIEIPEKPTAEPEIKIQLSPAKLRELRIGVGVGVEQQRHEVRLSARWTWRNFLGGLRTLTAEVKPAWVAIPALWDRARNGPAVDTELKLVQPDIFATRITAFAAQGYEVNVQAGYRYHGPRTQLGLDRFFLDELVRLGATWNLQFLDFFDIDQGAFSATATPLGLGFSDSYRLSFFEETVELDLRDASVDSRAGFFAALRFEQGVPETGGEFSYLKITPEARGYIPLGTKRLVLALRGVFGYMRPATGESTPVTRRFYLGGPNNHRGFGFRRLSTQTYDPGSAAWIPLGGNTSLLLSADLRLRLLKLGGSWLNLIGFLDAGDVVPRPEDLALDALHLAVGGSLLYQTPIGAIRIALGVRLNRLGCTIIEDRPPATDQTQVIMGCEPGVARMNPDPGERLAFHLTIGEAF